MRRRSTFTPEASSIMLVGQGTLEACSSTRSESSNDWPKITEQWLFRHSRDRHAAPIMHSRWPHGPPGDRPPGGRCWRTGDDFKISSCAGRRCPGAALGVLLWCHGALRTLGLRRWRCTGEPAVHALRDRRTDLGGAGALARQRLAERALGVDLGADGGG